MRNNIRIMRKISILDSLFSGVRQGILAATLTRPDKWWYLSELAEFIGTSPSSLQRELSALAQCGILEQRRDGRRVYFKAETRSPVFADLRGILEKTAGLVPALQNLLHPFRNEISIAFIYGSIARKEEHATSDVDLMVIGSAGLAELSSGLRNVEKQLGREINVTNYSVHEFRRKIRRHDHFLTGVLKSHIQLLIGERNDLEAIARPERREAPPNVERGTGKRARDHRA
jgi:DNA-binding transcriptional ArsR family regulator